ncbi:hypothetical protein B5P43_32900 [Bacillus sp. SRB_336]|nr:hypothetical protein B5P43_32900 [Bacillus sp. SRB_336]
MPAKLLRPEAGDASIFGVDVRSEAQIVRQHIGVAGQYGPWMKTSVPSNARSCSPNCRDSGNPRRDP